MKEDENLLTMAEQFLDEMIEAELEENADYNMFTQRFDPDTLKAVSYTHLTLPTKA